MYQKIPKVPDFPEIERRMLRFWAERRVFARLRAQIASSDKRWSFLDGPITANNPMGVHHAWGRSYKDMFQRYWAMRGYDQRFQNGFDCQGLWVEVEVEKALGFETRRDILDYGIDRFVSRCKERVLTYAARQTEQSIRLGYWSDWDDPDELRTLCAALHEDKPSVTVTTPTGKELSGTPEEIVGRLGSAEHGGSYFTFSDENNYTIWAFLKKCHEEGFIYRGNDVMPWCCRCGTGLSQMEVAEGRRITRHTSVFVRFPIRGRDREAFLVWTTTPWTLTSNVAVALHPEMTYLRVRHGEWTYYLGKENYERQRLQSLEAGGQRETHKLQTLQALLKGSGEVEVLGEVRGSELLGLAYDGPFDHLPVAGRPGGLDPYAGETQETSAAEIHRSIAWNEVSGAEGTGIVHIAPGCGAEDNELGKEHGLVVIAPLAPGGEFLDGFGDYTGRHVLRVADDIAQDLRQRGLLVGKESYPHVYPHCWRCKEELVFRLVDEWFIDMSWRDRIRAVVPGINWIPREGEARELDWLKNMGDWMISKKRFWGLALPIWVCGDCQEFTVIGSRDELRERAASGFEEFDGHSPHRPFVDRVKVRCESCGGVAERVEDVGNPWLDAGIVSFSTLGYNTNRAYWEKWFPADFVVESFPGQFRNWFYSLLAMSAMMDGRAPFKTLLGYALVLDERGEEMHKSAGNSIAFDEAAEVFGAEVMRYIYAAKNPTQNLLFPDLEHKGGGPSLADETRRKLLTLWNCYSFFVTYAGVDGWRPGAVPERSELGELDRWILSRLQRLVQSAHQAFADAAVYRLMAQFEQFDDELSNWYLRRSRRRFWKPGDDADKANAYHVLYTVLTTTIRVLAPVLPFLAEEVYQNLVRSVDDTAPESIHLTSYPEADPAWIDEALETRVDAVIRLKNLGLGLRSRANLKVRQPLGRLIVRPKGEADRKVWGDPHFRAQVLEEVNVKALELIDDEGGLVRRSLKPNFKALGKKHGALTKEIASRLAEVPVAELQEKLGAEGSYHLELRGGETVEIERGDVLIELETPENLVAAEEQGTFVALDTTLTPELEAEGIARDFNRQAQERRKALDLKVSDRISVAFVASERIVEAVTTHRAELCEELLADAIEAAPSLDEAVEVKVAGEKMKIWVGCV